MVNRARSQNVFISYRIADLKGVVDMSKKIQVTFEDWQVRRIEEVAEFLGMAVSAYIRMAVMEQVYRDIQVRLEYLKYQGSDGKIGASAETL